MNKINRIFILSSFVILLTACNNPTPTPTPPVSKEWYEDTSYINGLAEKDIGTIKEIKVNGINHQVRLIGIDHDVDEKGNKIHTTWEFANLISDSNGYSLAYQLNDSSEDAICNQDFPNSSMRKILCGSGKFSTSIYCSSKTSITQDVPTWDDSYKDKTILSMLPNDLVSVLKTVKKNVRTGSKFITVSDCSDKLFLLSTREMGDIGDSPFETEDEGEAYAFYKDLQSLDSKRIKKQVKGKEGALDKYVSFKVENTTVCKDYIFSYAGVNQDNIRDEGSSYWLRSPSSKSKGFGCACNPTGAISSYWVNSYAINIAPAFCI